MTYAGDLDPEAAWDVLASDPDAVLIDVRTPGEWELVGVADLASLGRKPHLIVWQHPDGRIADDFIVQLEAQVPRGATALFICRSGNRSRSAAMAATRAGWSVPYNVGEGMEGGPFGGGWKRRGLPWTTI